MSAQNSRSLKQSQISRQENYNQKQSQNMTSSNNASQKISRLSNGSNRNQNQFLYEKEMRPVQIKQPLQNSIIASVNQNGQPPTYTNKKTTKKKLSLLEQLCRCFLGSSNDQSPREEKSTQEEQDNKQLGPQQEIQKGKKTLILDLDETLVHSSFQPMNNSDYTLQIKVQNIPFTIHVKKRPGVEQFLERVSEIFEVVIYTASLAEYADPVCDLIDLKKTVSYRLFRESCTNYQGLFVKDLSKIGRDLKDLLIVDNSETSFLFQPENAIQISNFFQDDNDRELYRLLPFLQFLAEVKDVRTTKGWMEKYLTQDYIEYISMNGETQKYNKKLQMKKQKSIMNAEGSTIPLIKQDLQSISRDESQPKQDMNGNSGNNNNNMKNSILNMEQQGTQTYIQVGQESENQIVLDTIDKSQKVYNSKVMTASASTESGMIKKYKKKDLKIQLPLDDKSIAQNDQLISASQDKGEQSMIDEYNQKLSLPNNLNSVRANKLESTRKLLERGTPRVDEYFLHKTCPDEEQQQGQQQKDNNRLNKSFEKQRYDINMFNLNSPIAQQDFIEFLKEPIQTSPKLNKISNYFSSVKPDQPLPSHKYCDNFKLKLLMQQTQQIEENEMDIDPNALQIDQIILDRSHSPSKSKNMFDKQNNPNQQCEIINFTDDNIKN